MRLQLLLLVRRAAISCTAPEKLRWTLALCRYLTCGRSGCPVRCFASPKQACPPRECLAYSQTVGCDLVAKCQGPLKLERPPTSPAGDIRESQFCRPPTYVEVSFRMQIRAVSLLHSVHACLGMALSDLHLFVAKRDSIYRYL